MSNRNTESPQVHPIAAVEIEVSLWSYEEETKKGAYMTTFSRVLNLTATIVIETAKELGIAVVAYS